eukprot:3316675-Alexandrium_andersonii.AAC.1
MPCPIDTALLAALSEQLPARKTHRTLRTSMVTGALQAGMQSNNNDANMQALMQMLGQILAPQGLPLHVNPRWARPAQHDRLVLHDGSPLGGLQATHEPETPPMLPPTPGSSISSGSYRSPGTREHTPNLLAIEPAKPVATAAAPERMPDRIEPAKPLATAAARESTPGIDLANPATAPGKSVAEMAEL